MAVVPATKTGINDSLASRNYGGQTANSSTGARAPIVESIQFRHRFRGQQSVTMQNRK